MVNVELSKFLLSDGSHNVTLYRLQAATAGHQKQSDLWPLCLHSTTLTKWQILRSVSAVHMILNNR